MVIIITSPMNRSDLVELAKKGFGDVVKGVVDVRRAVVALAGELHSDEEVVLLEDGSKQEDLWGVNLYPEKQDQDWIEFDSMINIRPAQGNRSRGVENQEVRKQIITIVNTLFPL